MKPKVSFHPIYKGLETDPTRDTSRQEVSVGDWTSANPLPCDLQYMQTSRQARQMKQLGINPTKKVKGFYTENHNILKKRIEEDIRK